MALGLTFDASDTRKFSLDVTALTKVTCEMVAVPPPRQLMALADRMTKTEAPKTEAPKTEAPAADGGTDAALRPPVPAA